MIKLVLTFGTEIVVHEAVKKVIKITFSLRKPHICDFTDCFSFGYFWPFPIIFRN